MVFDRHTLAGMPVLAKRGVGLCVWFVGMFRDAFDFLITSKTVVGHLVIYTLHQTYVDNLGRLLFFPVCFPHQSYGRFRLLS